MSDINVARTTMGRHASNSIHNESKFVAQVIRTADNGVRRIDTNSVTKQQISGQEIAPPAYERGRNTTTGISRSVQLW